jgi:hypothetical protein
MSVNNDHRQRPRAANGPAAPPAAMGGLDALLDALPPAAVAERRPVVRLAPNREPAVAAERFAVSRAKLEAELGPAAEDDEDLLRHAADRVAARLPAAVLSAAGGVPARAPVLLPLPLRPLPDPAPRPGLVGVLPLAAAAPRGGGGEGCPLAARRAELAALGWRLGLGGLDADALRFVAPAALLRSADLLLLRWSPALAELEDPLGGADPQALVLTGCDGADALAWGRDAGLVLFSGPGAEAMLPPPAAAAAEAAPW